MEKNHRRNFREFSLKFLRKNELLCYILDSTRVFLGLTYRSVELLHLSYLSYIKLKQKSSNLGINPRKI
jgi:hypothetical protein